MRFFAGHGVTLLQAQRWAGTLTAVFAFLACAVSGELGLPLVALFFVALLGAWFARGRLYGRGDWMWTAVLAAVMLLFAAQVFVGQLDIVVAAARFAELLLIHRLWHRGTQRDELLLLLLSLLALCAGASLAAELTFGLAFLGYAVAGTWALALTHLRFEIEAGRGPQGSAALLNSRRIATPALLAGLAALATLGLAGSAVVFFTFPRLTLRALHRPGRPSAVAGLSDHVDLARQGEIADDPRVVLRVQLDPAPRGDPSSLGFHWRAHALSRWTGQGWRAEETGMMPARTLPRRPKSGGHPATLSAEVETVGGFDDGIVLTPDGWPLSVQFRRPLSAHPVTPRLYRNAAGDLFYQPADAGDVRYVVTVDTAEPGLADLRGRGQQYPRWLAADLEVPGNLNPRVVALAKRLGAGKDPVDAALAVERWLTMALTYTRELPGEVADPISDFLFRRRAGHCELFSSAMVLMLRSLGIPARNVTGYYGGQRTDAGYYAVRAGDAHSWVEVWFPDAGYVSFDPTPPALRGGVKNTAWARMVLLWDALQQRWRVFVVDYNLVAQAQAMQRVVELISEAGHRLAGKGGSADRLRVLLAGLGVALLAGALALWARQVRSGGRPQKSQGPALDREQRRAFRLWRRGRATLRAAGVELAPSTTPWEAARRTQLPAVVALVSAYNAARWGGSPLSRAQVRGLLRDLKTSLRS
ncbi:MAG TPA: DUF3488 and transglutaminase-like domain-containing protein [Myxococcales bacterium]|nr:DUF3488 and transglutaminase-like domain-containing protein [Myxococcales bacterium]